MTEDRYKAYSAGFEAGKEAGKLAAFEELGIDPNCKPKPSRSRYKIQALAPEETESQTDSVANQNAKVLSYLRRGGRLTPKDALHMFGCFRLSARIFNLREAGWSIETEYLRVGLRTVVARFSMPEGAKQGPPRQKVQQDELSF